ncbi:aspartate aminotransferase family protein [Paenibacillus sp. 481]|uniref:aspartate aminotransferase family protein n=1 Tax=Paenibacillus sp. 481 TaxID=2835869 RepID=UPI001E390819|nr:aspartate aminotransferase family protein [Paenibacillus sp. 481]UHA75743.1 aspartate aminotransferase family protein [Paenibacillus sp. 481]
MNAKGRACSHLIKPILDYNYPSVTHGKGIYLYDAEGKMYVDGCSGAVTASIGHGVQDVVQAMQEQAAKVSFVYRSQFTSEAAEQLAHKLSDAAPGGEYWSFFVNSGSEATETAMKIAIQYWQEKGIQGKYKIISRRMSYHGITLGSLSMSGHVLRRKRFTPLLEDFPIVEPAFCYRCPFEQTYPACDLMCAGDLEAAIKRIGAEHIAAFIAEPIVGAAGGAVVPPAGYYERIKHICERYNVLFIADEVMTGIARTGKMFAMEHWKVEPDIIALGKGMSAGYTPMAATLVSERVMEPIWRGSKSIMSGHTYSANPQSAAVSLAVLNYIEQHGLVEAAEVNGRYLLERLQQLAQRCELIGDVRGKGMLLAFEVVAHRADKRSFPPERGVTSLIIATAMEKGLLLYPAAGGLDGTGDAVIIAPPLIITQPEMDMLLTLLEETLREVTAELLRTTG